MALILLEFLCLFLSRRLRLLAALYAGALVVFFLSEIREHTGLCTVSLEPLERTV